jgi:hypothetical protein
MFGLCNEVLGMDVTYLTLQCVRLVTILYMRTSIYRLVHLSLNPCTARVPRFFPQMSILRRFLTSPEQSSHVTWDNGRVQLVNDAFSTTQVSSLRRLFSWTTCLCRIHGLSKIHLWFNIEHILLNIGRGRHGVKFLKITTVHNKMPIIL